MIEDPVDSPGEREYVLRLQRDHERRPQRLQNLPFGFVSPVLGSSKGLGGRRIAGSPSRENASMPSIVTAT